MPQQIIASSRSRPPVAFCVTDWLMRRNVRGAYRLWKLLLEAGLMSRTVRYTIPGRFRSTDIFVPLGRPESSVSAEFVRAYEDFLVAAIAEPANASGHRVLAIDCGADIGIVASALIREIEHIDELIAFEPNETANRHLAATLMSAPVPARALNCAVGAASGRGRLVAPPHASDAHSLFVEPCTDGPILITTLDEAMDGRGRYIALKVDVEGTERDVLDGARRLLRDAPGFAVAFEANRTVCMSRGDDPCETIRRLSAIRPVRLVIAELPAFSIDPDTPFFDQVGDIIPHTGRPIFNIVVSTL